MDPAVHEAPTPGGSASSPVPRLRGKPEVSFPPSTFDSVLKSDSSLASWQGVLIMSACKVSHCLLKLKHVSKNASFPPTVQVAINVCTKCQMCCCMNHVNYCITKNLDLFMCKTCQMSHCLCLYKTQGLIMSHTGTQHRRLGAEMVNATEKVNMNTVLNPLLCNPLKRSIAVSSVGSQSGHFVKVKSGRFAKVQRLSPSRPAEGATTQVNAADPAQFVGPLARCLSQWKACDPHPWVLNTIEKGYKLQFAGKPPMFEKVLFSQATGQAADILQAEIASLLSKNAIREVPMHQAHLGFYSRYFIVKKKGGGFRPILDLRQLNKFLKVFKFKMLTNVTLLNLIREGDWFTSLDLQDAYFHIEVYQAHRKFLRFGFRGKIYEFQVIPFGLSLSPRVFVKCSQAAIAPLRRQGVRIASFIDDWLICAGSREESLRHTELVVSHVTSMGFTVNSAKSVLMPTRSIVYIGLLLDSITFTARLSPDRVTSTLACARSFRVGQRVSFTTCRRMAGIMASSTSVIRLGRLYMKPFQRWMRSLGIPNTAHHRMVSVNAECTHALQQWTTRSFLSEGVTMGLVLSRKIITTDASLTGWGATFQGRMARGVWDDVLRSEHIHFLELMAVYLALQHFEPLIVGCHVLVRTDNTTTKFYINKQGGLRSYRLHVLAEELTLWCDARLKSIRAAHVPGVDNRGADLLSRGRCHYAEWSLHDAVAAQLWNRFGRPVMDLFASEENAKCPRFFSVVGRNPVGLDALAQVWPRGLLYAFPPLSLIPPFLERVRTQRLRAILIAPGWGVWRSEITPLLYDQPWCLPLRRDLLSQAGGEIFHPHPEHLDLWAFPVRG